MTRVRYKLQFNGIDWELYQQQPLGWWLFTERTFLTAEAAIRHVNRWQQIYNWGYLLTHEETS